MVIRTELNTLGEATGIGLALPFASGISQGGGSARVANGWPPDNNAYQAEVASVSTPVTGPTCH